MQIGSEVTQPIWVSESGKKAGKRRERAERDENIGGETYY